MDKLQTSFPPSYSPRSRESESGSQEQERQAVGYSGTTTTSRDSASEEEGGKVVKRNLTTPRGTVVVNDRDGKTYQNYVREGIVRKRVQQEGVVVDRKPPNAERVKIIYPFRENSTLNNDFSRGYGSTGVGYGSMNKGGDASTVERYGASTGGYGIPPSPKEEEGEKCSIM